MKVEDLQNIAALRDSASLSPPREWLAVHKETGKDLGSFDFSDVRPINGKPCLILVKDANGLEVDWVALELCHLCAFTGYTDSKGEKVFEGHLVNGKVETRPLIVLWRRGGWVLSKIPVVKDVIYCWLNDQAGASHILEGEAIIGHIYTSKLGADGIKPWPEEVRRLLE